MKYSLITVFILFFFSHPSFSQGQIEKKGGRYKYDGEQIKNHEIKRLIIPSGDSKALNYYKKYEIGVGLAAGSMVVGGVIFFAGLGKFYEGHSLTYGGKFQIQDGEKLRQGRSMMWGGGVLLLVGMITAETSQTSLRNAVNRYNSLQEQTKLEFGITQDGVGLIYKF